MILGQVTPHVRKNGERESHEVSIVGFNIEQVSAIHAIEESFTEESYQELQHYCRLLLGVCSDVGAYRVWPGNHGVDYR